MVYLVGRREEEARGVDRSSMLGGGEFDTQKKTHDSFHIYIKYM